MTTNTGPPTTLILRIWQGVATRSSPDEESSWHQWLAALALVSPMFIYFPWFWICVSQFSAVFDKNGSLKRQINCKKNDKRNDKNTNNDNQNDNKHDNWKQPTKRGYKKWQQHDNQNDTNVITSHQFMPKFLRRGPCRPVRTDLTISPRLKVGETGEPPAEGANRSRTWGQGVAKGQGHINNIIKLLKTYLLNGFVWLICINMFNLPRYGN